MTGVLDVLEAVDAKKNVVAFVGFDVSSVLFSSKQV
jgi:hypothetical protein